ncbi:MAG: ATPase, partial [Proteobacteria bacterium]|nr:ATPase [Pseudomonadota bacterium]
MASESRVEDRVGGSDELKRVFSEVKQVIVGQDTLIERLLVALLARGHILLEGVPGLAKTLAVKTIAEVVG